MSLSFAPVRLRRHADFQRVYAGARKQHSRQIAYFVLPRPAAGTPPPPAFLNAPSTAPPQPRIGLTVGKVMGNAVVRNRIKRRLREAIRTQLHLLPLPVDVVLHPRRTVLTLPLPELQREIAGVFRSIARGAAPRPAPHPRPAPAVNKAP